MLRGAISISNDVIRSCYGPLSKSVNAVIGDMAQRLMELASTGTTDQFIRLQEAASKAIDKRMNDEIRRVKTGLREIDDIVGGMPLSKFIIIAGRPAMGKSQLCKQIVLNAAMSKISSAVVTIEEGEGKVAENMIANLSGIENRRIAYGQIAQEEWGEIGGAINRMKGVNFWINDHPTKLSEVVEAITTAKLKHDCQLVVVDYLQLISPDESGENENREITQISHALKGLAKRLDIALIAACQLNRGNESHGVRPPALKDLRGSGTIEQDGDLIILLHRPDYYLSHEDQDQRNNQLHAIVAKNKDGPTGTVPLYFDAKTQRIADWRPHEPPNF
jgi:replicative DNA helicase